MNSKSMGRRAFAGAVLFGLIAVTIVAVLFLFPGNPVPVLVLVPAGCAVFFVTVLGLVSDYRDLDHWYGQILDFVYLPMSVTDMNMRWTFINKPVKDIIGVTREQVLGHQCSEWGADVCDTEKCGIAMLRNGLGSSFFTNEGVDRNFKVDTAYLFDRRKPDLKIGHLELVSDVTSSARLEQAVAHLRTSSERLAGTIEEEAATTEELSSTSEEFSKTLQSIRDNVEKQTGNIDETVSAVEEMTASIDTVAKTVSAMSARGRENETRAKNSEEKIRESIRSVTVIGDSLGSVAGKLDSLSGKTVRIDEVLKVINTIAAQTNLLAMNAAIEAAHAGEYGQGFSVVAIEIRKLAENAQVSAKQIEAMVKEIKEGVRESTEMAVKSRQAVDGNVRDTEASLSALEQIVLNVGELSRMTNEIELISREQAAAAGEVLGHSRDVKNLSLEIRNAVAEQSLGIGHITEALHLLAANTQENARAAEELKEISKKLSV